MGSGATAASPAGGAVAHHAGEDASEVALIGEAAFEGDFGDIHPGVEQQGLGPVDAMALPPLMWGEPRGGLERLGEIAARQTALLGDFGQSDVTLAALDDDRLGLFGLTG